MSRTAASPLHEALENAGVRYTFGIPGVHNTEIYDERAKSASISAPALRLRPLRAVWGGSSFP